MTEGLPAENLIVACKVIFLRIDYLQKSCQRQVVISFQKIQGILQKLNIEQAV